MLGVFAIPVIFQIGKLLFNETFGLVTALFLAVSGFHIQYSQEARAYSLYFLLMSVSTFFSVLIYQKRTKYASVGYVLSTALLLYSHNTALFSVAAVMVCYLILARPWRASKIYPLLVTNVVAVLLYAPYIPVWASQAIKVGKQGLLDKRANL